MNVTRDKEDKEKAKKQTQQPSCPCHLNKVIENIKDKLNLEV